MDSYLESKHKTQSGMTWHFTQIVKNQAQKITDSDIYNFKDVYCGLRKDTLMQMS